MHCLDLAYFSFKQNSEDCQNLRTAVFIFTTTTRAQQQDKRPELLKLGIDEEKQSAIVLDGDIMAMALESTLHYRPTLGKHVVQQGQKIRDKRLLFFYNTLFYFT